MNLEQAASGVGILAVLAGGVLALIRLVNRPLVKEIEFIKVRLDAGAAKMEEQRITLHALVLRMEQVDSPKARQELAELIAAEQVKLLRRDGWAPRPEQ